MDTTKTTIKNASGQGIPRSRALLWGNNAAWLCTTCEELLGNRVDADHVDCVCGASFKITSKPDKSGGNLGPATGVEVIKAGRAMAGPEESAGKVIGLNDVKKASEALMEYVKELQKASREIEDSDAADDTTREVLFRRFEAKKALVDYGTRMLEQARVERQARALFFATLALVAVAGLQIAVALFAKC